MTGRRHLLLGLAAVGIVIPGCGGTSRPAPLPPAAEPATSPPLHHRPAGRVMDLAGQPEGIVADPSTGLVAVALRGPPRLALIDARTHRVGRCVPLPRSARHLALSSPEGRAPRTRRSARRTVLVPAESADELIEVAVSGHPPTVAPPVFRAGRCPDRDLIAARIPVGRHPHDAARDGARILVSDELGRAVSVVRGGRVVRTLRGFPQPAGVARAGPSVGIVDVRANDLPTFDARTLRRTGHAPAGAGPTHLVATGPGRFAVADTRGGALESFHAGPGDRPPRRTSRLALPGSPYGIAVDPRRDRVYVTLTARNRLVAFHTTGGALHRIASWPTVRQPNTVAVDPVRDRVYVAGRMPGRLETIAP